MNFDVSIIENNTQGYSDTIYFVSKKGVNPQFSIYVYDKESDKEYYVRITAFWNDKLVLSNNETSGKLKTKNDVSYFIQSQIESASEYIAGQIQAQIDTLNKTATDVRRLSQELKGLVFNEVVG